MTKKTITRLEYKHAVSLLEQGRRNVTRAGDHCKDLIGLLEDVEPGEITDAVFGGHTDIDELLRRLGIAVRNG